MRSRLSFLALAVAAALLAFAPAAQGAESNCDETMVNVTGCINGPGVDLVGIDGQPGSPGDSGNNSGGNPDTTRDDFTRCFLEEVDCEDDPGTPPITIQDIARFRPTPGTQKMQPDGWTIAGLHTNFYAQTSTHVVNGQLLGRPAAVRFTPISYAWAYGDGETATKSTKGDTWKRLGIPEFERTPTSHVYDEVGGYTITLRITFAAEYRFGSSGWRPVVGTITLPANDLHIRAGTAKTVLVDEHCLANPSGPGC